MPRLISWQTTNLLPGQLTPPPPPLAFGISCQMHTCSLITVGAEKREIKLTFDSSRLLTVKPRGFEQESCNGRVTSVSPKQSAVNMSWFSGQVPKDPLPYKPCAWNNLAPRFNIWRLATLPDHCPASVSPAHLTCCLSLTVYRIWGFPLQFLPPLRREDQMRKAVFSFNPALNAFILKLWIYHLKPSYLFSGNI